MRRLYLELKNQRVYYFVPLLIVFLFVPLAVLATIKGGSGNNFSEFETISQLFIPSFAVWWPIFVLKEYLDSPGKELLFVHRYGKEFLLLKMIFLWVLFVVHVALVFVLFSFLFNFVWYLFIAIAVQSMFMIAFAYLLSMLFQNTFVPLIASFAYSSIFMLVLYDSRLSIFGAGFGGYDSLSKPAVISVIAVMLLSIGYQLEKKLYRNNI